jgi:divalent metal cation (Fe/Co/Zn/Cd) transporter
MVGVAGIGVGLWWADAVAAMFISVDIAHDGWRNVRAAVHDLMDARPRRHDAREFHPIVTRMTDELERCEWVEDAAVRLREEGHVFTGEVLVVPVTEQDLLERLEELADRLLSLEWKVYDIVVVPVREIDIPIPARDGESRGDEERRRPGGFIARSPGRL